MHIFHDPSIKLEEERHKSLLKKLNITEEEYQLREKKRKEEQYIINKKKEKKEQIQCALLYGAILLLLFAIAYFTHWHLIASLFAIILGFSLWVFVSFFLMNYLVKIKIFSWLDKASDAKYFIFLLLGIVTGWNSSVGSYKFLTYEEGNDQVVYITPYGYCYHMDRDCYHIVGHKISRTTFGDIKRRRSPCETCSER